MNSFVLFLLALVAASATTTSLRNEIKNTVKKVDAATELKRFEEEMRAKKFDEKVGKFLYKQQQATKKMTSFFPRSGTTYNAEGKPLITTRIVSTEASDYFTIFVSNEDETSCADADMYAQISGSLNVCSQVETFDHSSNSVSATYYTKTTISDGDAPWTVFMGSFSDDSCDTSIGSAEEMVVSDTCEAGGVDLYGSNYGYGAKSTSLVKSAPNAEGVMELEYASAGCDTALGSSWYSVTAYAGDGSGFGDCVEANGMSGVYLTYKCSGGDLTGSLYSDDTCETEYSIPDGVFDDGYNVDGNTLTLIDKGDCDAAGDDDASSGSDDRSEDAAYTSGYCTTVTSSDETAVCFAGSEMVTLQSGVSKPIADVVVGDRVLAANAQGALRFSDVIAVPHAKNNDRVVFNEISLANGADIRMTGEHLLPVAASCGVDAVFTVVAAKDVAVESCVMTVDGQSSVVSNNKVAGSGIYTIVTNEEYVVVNGIVASPFAASHVMGNTFYNVYRAMYNYVPGLFKSSVFQTFHSTFATLASKTW